MRRLRPLAVVVVACALALSGVVAPLGAAVFAQPAAGQDDVPRGMVGVPNSNVHDNVPDHAVEKMPSADDFRGSVMTNRHAESLSVSVTTRGQVDGRASSCRAGRTPEWCESPELALVLADGTNHDGRTVTVPKRPVVANLGRVPELAYIAHSSGDQYEVQVTDHGDQLAFHVREFSENTVTFSGEIQLTGDPAADGAQFSYDLDNASSASNYTIDVTGSTAKAWSNESATGLVAATSATVDVGGNLDPVGPSANGKPVLEVTGHAERGGTFNYSGGGHSAYAWGYDGAYIESEFRIPDAPSAIDEIQLHINQTGSNYDAAATSVDVYIQEGAPDSTAGNGNLVVSGYTPTAGTGDKTISGFSYEPTSDEVTVEFVTTAADTSGNYGEAFTHADSNQVWGSTTYWDTVMGTDSYAHQVEASGSPSNVTADADDASASATLGDFADGETKTVEFGLSGSASAIDFGGAGKIDYVLEMEERTQTQDPVVEVNGQTTSYTGALADGETVALSTDTGWLQDGTNRVNVSLTSPTSGPSGQTGLDYSHSAESRQTTEYEGETWTERYNVSRTYAESRNGAALRIPFASDRVVAVRDLEVRTNGGSWSTIPESDRDFDGSELVAQIGDVQAGDKVEVRAAASKVRTQNGEITVLKPTVEGNTLETEVELSAWASDAYIDVTGTHPDHNLHHAVNKSWTDPEDYALVRSAGQELYFPAASSGATARIETLPLEVRPNNDIQVRVTSGGFEPTLEVSPGPTKGDDVEWYYKHSNLQTGETYLLWSKSDGKVVDQAEASSPISLFSSDDTQTLQILHDDDGNTTSGSGGGGFWEQGESAVREYAPVIDPEIILFVALLLLVGGVAYSERKSPETPAHKRPGVILGSVAALGVALLFLAPNAVAEPVQTALQATLPLLGLGAVGFAGLVAYGWYRKQQNESKPATIQVMGREK